MSGAFSPIPPLVPCDPPDFSGIPNGLTSLARWVVWRLEPNPDPKKRPVKKPYNGNIGYPAKVVDEATWATYAQARKAVEYGLLKGPAKDFSGLGLVLGPLTDTLRVVGLDIDTCLDDDGQVLPWAAGLIAWLIDKAYLEISPSRTGLKAVFIVAESNFPTIRAMFNFPVGREEAKFLAPMGHTGGHPPCVDFFLGQRYFTITGWRWAGGIDDVEMLTMEQLNALLLLLPKGKPAAKTGAKKTPDDPTDRSREAFIFGLARANAGETDAVDTLREALLASGNPDLISWTEEKGGEDEPGVRQLQNIVDKVAAIVALAGQSSHDALALGFTDRHEHELRYVAAWGKWIILGPEGWAEDETLKVFDLSRSFARDVAEGFTPFVAKTTRSAATVAAILTMARSSDAIAATHAQWDADLRVLNTPEGILDLTTGLLRPRTALDYALKRTAARVAEDEACPLWFAFLARVTAGDADLVAYLRRVCGYWLTGLTTEHALFFFHGTGRNGKGVFLDTVRMLLGSYAQGASAETFTATRNPKHLAELAVLEGARLVVAQETDEGQAWNEARVKALTGGDPITANRMRHDPFTFTPRLKLAMSSNYKPTLRSVDPAIRSRIHLIPFTVFIPPEERDLALKEKLEAEWPGILRWMANGCLEWQAEGLKPPTVVTAATEQYFEAEDTTTQFLNECCFLAGETDEHGHKVPRDFFTPITALFAVWDGWAKANGLEVGSTKKLHAKLARFEYVQRKIQGKPERGYLGIKRRETKMGG